MVNSRKRNNIDTAKVGIVKITFRNTIKGIPLILNKGLYINPFSEQYIVTKFKYYISNVCLLTDKTSISESSSYHLIDEIPGKPKNFTFTCAANTYQKLEFLLGVDSLHNVSGAQSGALDPLNGMFWTWNTGYVMAKMEGNSPQSVVLNNKLEYHIGGFSGAANVLKMISFSLPAGKLLVIRGGKTSEIIIEADLDKWWQSPNEVRFSDNPVCTSPGKLAKKIADNYCKMFTIKDVINY